MKCPRCGNDELIPPNPCPECSFSGPLDQIEELGHVQYLLKELAGWSQVSQNIKERLQARYSRRQRQLEIELELRLPPLSRDAARAALQERMRLRQLLAFISYWTGRDWIKPAAAAALSAQIEERCDELGDRLSEPDTPPVSAFRNREERVDLLKSLRDDLDRLKQKDAWTDEEAYQAAIDNLEQRVERLETDLGLRRRPEIKKLPPQKPAPAPTAEPPPKPREPITWERIRRTLLSERTLRVLLFVSVFLLFASAVTLVVYNWPRFRPLVQVAILTGFTIFFYVVGWYVRTKLELPQSSIALFATGSLLIPVDFSAIYRSGGIFPPEAWAEVWWMTSAVCLVAYVITAATLRAEFFGYLVGVAIGSLLCATFQVIDIPGEWWTSSLSALALLLMLPSWRWEHGPEESLPRVFGRPFRHLALLTVTSILLLATGLHIAGQLPHPASRLPLALDWWLACGIYVIAAARHPRRHLLTSTACVTAPAALFLTLRLYLEKAEIDPWHALGWALLTPIYLIVGWRLSRLPKSQKTSEVSQGQGRIVVGWTIALIILAAGRAFGDMSAAAAAHGVLTGSVALAVVLWQRPNLLLFTSLLSFSTVTTWMSTLGLDLAQYSLGWVLLAILHVIAAVLLRRVQTRPPQPAYASMLYAAGCAAAALSLLPPLALDTHLMAYALGNWIALAGWMAWLAHKKDEHPGLHHFLRLAGSLRRSALHWAAALPFPIWFWLTWTNARAADAWLGVGFAILAWACLGLGRWLARHDKAYGLPWYTVSFACSVIGSIATNVYPDQILQATAFLSEAMLYFSYAYLFRNRWWLLAGGFVFPFGYILALDHLGLPPDPLVASLALVPAAYVLVAIWLEQRRGVEAGFLEPLYGVAHVVAAAAFLWGFGGLWKQVVEDIPWTDDARLWAAGGQLLLGVTYGLAAWFLEEKPWGHVAAWLGVIAGGLVATAYSQGRGSSAAKAALLAMVYVGAERALHTLRERHPLPRKAWPLYRGPLLIAGWTVSGGTIALALVRNLWLLGGGAVREDWAIVGLLLIVALYAVSARLFRRPLFLWLAAPLLFVPWTLLTHRGWYIWQSPPAPRYALAWVVLAWALVLLGLLLDERAGRRYGFPLRTTAHVLLPFALLWGSADPSTSSATCGLGLAFYVLAAITDHRRGRTGLSAARFLYPAALLLPVWAIYLLAWRWPWLPHAHFGLLLLALSLPVLVIARRLRHVQPADALPFYLACYGCAIVGTMLVSYDRSLLVLALLFDAGVALLSARLFREPLWIYPTAALPPAALLLALAEADWNPHRRGWWLIGLGAIYLTQSWALRRPSQSPNQKSPHLQSYATPLMAAAYAIIALGLPISSYERTAAFWGYGGTALIYAISAVWLRQPLLLTPAVGLSAVPYAVALDWIPWLTPVNYGLAMWPGIVVALMTAHLLDYYLSAPCDFPWGQPDRWLLEAARRLTEWWGLPLYVSGYVGALASAALSPGHSIQLVLTLSLAAAIYSLATIRFWLRGWLLITAATTQAAALAVIQAAATGVFRLPQAWIEQLTFGAWQAFTFLPVTLATAAAGLWIEHRQGEGSPFTSLRALWRGWSRPFHWLLALDFLAVQIVAASRWEPGTLVSLVHALLFAALAVVWTQPVLPYFSTVLGLLAVIQRLFWVRASNTDAPVAFAVLAVGYGLFGYGLEYARTRAGAKSDVTILERPLEQSGLAISAISVLMMLTRGINIWGWLVRALLGRPLMAAEDVPVVQMAVAVLALVGLLYSAMAMVRRWNWRGYGAVALLLCAWSLEWFLVWDLREVQWYAIPAGLYLLGAGYLEWHQERRDLARWIDRAALLLLLGSVFYQSLAEEHHWPYAILMVGESLLVVWYGSARRQQRFLYAGVVGVVVAVVGQLIKQIFTINAFMAFGIPGLIIMVLYILIERNLETVKRLSQEWQERLEEWE